MGERYPSVQTDKWTEVSGVRTAEGKAVNKRLKDAKDEVDQLNKMVEEQNSKLAKYTTDLNQAQASNSEQSTKYKNKLAELEKELEAAQAATGKVAVVRNKDILSQRNYTTSERVMKVGHYNSKLVEGIVEAERYKREISSLNANIARLEDYLDSRSRQLSAAAKEDTKEEEGGSTSEGKTEEVVELDAAAGQKEAEKVSDELKKQIDDLRKVHKVSAGVIEQLGKESSQSGAKDAKAGSDDLDKQLRELEEEERRLEKRHKKVQESLKNQSEPSVAATVGKAVEGFIENVQQQLETTTKDIQSALGLES